MPAKLIEFAAIFLFVSNYCLAGASACLCYLLYRRQCRCGWLVLGIAFLTPFYFLALRASHGMPVLNYKTLTGMDSNGVEQVTYKFDFPSFYLATFLGLLWLWWNAHRGKPLA